ncbi:MAG: polysaccharide pyruvyl transferase family protein [Opitutaceae bacterium]|nr:polysaccharide pyruvyl transferase family protein [Opitutaceae bacterium]
MNRRDCLLSTTAAVVTTSLGAATKSGPVRGPRILLREALQYENIGDVGRVPGTIRLFERHLPGAEVTLWPWSLHAREREMLRGAFPRLKIAEGEIDARGRASTPELAAAWSGAEIFVSPSKNARTFTEWAATGRPYGLFGAAFDPITDRAKLPDGLPLAELQARIDRLPEGEFARKFGDRALYERAAFIYCRDSLSLRFLQREKVRPGVLEFGPEGCFALDLRDETRAADWLKRNGLAGEDYLCVVPRLRYTPYYRVRNLPRSKSDYEIDALNARTTTSDHAPLRDLIVQWVRRTGLRVVACPEMTYQIETAKEQLIDPLPEDVKRRVIWRDTFWLPDEAASIYARARAVVSVECHSPIIALAVGTPTLHVRQPVDTVKAQMYRDIGVGDWLFEVTETSGDALWSTLQKIHDDLPGARARVRTVMAKVAEIQRTMTETLGRAARRA